MKYGLKFIERYKHPENAHGSIGEATYVDDLGSKKRYYKGYWYSKPGIEKPWICTNRGYHYFSSIYQAWENRNSASITIDPEVNDLWLIEIDDSKPLLEKSDKCACKRFRFVRKIDYTKLRKEYINLISLPKGIHKEYCEAKITFFKSFYDLGIPEDLVDNDAKGLAESIKYWECQLEYQK